MNDRYRRWFDTSAGMGPVRGNTLCTFHISGEAAFGDIGLSLVGDAGDRAAVYLMDSWPAKGLLTLIDVGSGADAWMRDVVEDPDTSVPDPS